MDMHRNSTFSTTSAQTNSRRLSKSTVSLSNASHHMSTDAMLPNAQSKPGRTISAPGSPPATPSSLLPNGISSCRKQTSRSISFAHPVTSPTSRPKLAWTAPSISTRVPLLHPLPASSSMSLQHNIRTWDPTVWTAGTSAHPSSTTAATSAISPAPSASATP